MFHIKDDFKAGQPVSAVPASWFNRVAGLLNNLIGTKGVTLTKEGEPPLVTIDTEWLGSYLASNATTDYTTVKSGGDAKTDNNKDTWTSGGKKGAKVSVCTLAYNEDDTKVHLRWRTLTISADGRITGISAEDSGVVVYPGV